MAFLAISSELRTFDTERGLELVNAGGGSGGHLRFILHGPNFEVRFSAFPQAELIPGAAADLPAPLRQTLIWKVSGLGRAKGLSFEQTKEIVCEALKAYKRVHGKPAQLDVKVQF